MAAKQPQTNHIEPKAPVATADLERPSPSQPSAVATQAAGLACNICGGTEFKPGPNGRMVHENIAPACAGCGSYERHRAVRQIFDQVRPRNFSQLSALQFGRDRGIAGGWFKQFQRANDETNDTKAIRLSLNAIALPDASMDAVICNFQLENLPEYRAALREIGRIISDHGFAFVAVQSPHLRKVTQELCEPQAGQGNRYRTFGQDIEQEMAASLPDLHVIRVVGQDPVTRVAAWGYFITPDDDFAGYLFERKLSARFVNIRKVMA